MDIPSIKDINDQEVLEHCVIHITLEQYEVAARRAREGTIRQSILDLVNKLVKIEAEKERSKKQLK